MHDMFSKEAGDDTRRLQGDEEIVRVHVPKDLEAHSREGVRSYQWRLIRGEVVLVERRN